MPTKPPKVTYEILLTLTDDGQEGYLKRKEIRDMLIDVQRQWAGVTVKIQGIKELPPRERE